MNREAKSSQLQIRVTARQKAGLQRLAAAAGLDMSAYVLARALPASRHDFERCIARCTEGEALRFALADLHRLLRLWTQGELADAIETRPARLPDALAANYMAALIEQSCALRKLPLPDWVRAIEPLRQPWFASQLTSLRLLLLASSPPSFRSRNLFVDSGLGSQR